MVKNSLLDSKERKIEDNITADKMIKINKNVIKDIRNPFRMKKENEVIKRESLEILEIFLSSRKKIIINHYNYYKSR